MPSRTLRSPLLLALALLLAACERPVPPPVELGIPWELAEHRSRTLSGLHYRFDLTVPASREEPVSGRALLEFEWNDPDAFDLVVDFVRPPSGSGPCASTAPRPPGPPWRTT